MYDKVKSYAQRNKMFSDCRHVVIGLSGGADSVCLAHIMKRLSQELGFGVSALHLHHGIRGAEADRDMDYCKRLCRGLGMELAEIYRDVPAYAKEQGITCEEAGRSLRYGAMRGEAAARGGAKIAVAHHMNDQAETVIFNMCRGSGLRGMRGMLPVRDMIVRPLLCCTRAEIEEYLEEQGLDFCDDSTNAADEYSRNRIRHGVLPFLAENVNSAAVRNIAAMAEHMAEAEAYLEAETEAGYGRAAKAVGAGILLSGLENEPPYMAGRIIMRALEELASGLKDIGRVHVEAVAALINADSGKCADVRRGIMGRRVQDGIFLYRDGEMTAPVPVSVRVPSSVTPWDGAGSFEFSLEDWDAGKKISNCLCTKCFDYDKIKSNLRLRTREDGDYLVIDGLGHRKKLNQYFIDEKIPGYMRDRTALLADGSHILWVVGGRISSEYKVTDRTRRVLRVKYGGLNDGED